MYPNCPYDPTTTEFPDDGRCPVTKGTLYGWQHATYGPWVVKVVKFLDAVAYAAGQSCEAASLGSAGGASVTNDRSGGSSLGNIAKGGGLALMVNTTAKVGFVLVQGYYPTIKTSGADDIAVGESLILHSSTDGACDGVAAGSTTTASFGTAQIVDVDANDTVGGIVNFL